MTEVGGALCLGDKRRGRTGAITRGWWSESALRATIVAFAAWQLWITFKKQGMCTENAELVIYSRN